MRDAANEKSPPATDPPAHGGFFVGGWPAPVRRTGALLATLILVVVSAGAVRTDGAAPALAELQARLAASQEMLAARTGELELARIELDRLATVHRESDRYGIPADLAAAIHDIAVAEGISPGLAFSLVSVESRFAARAVSSKGAVGLTQVMPLTALDVEPGISAAALMDERTNLRLGFRYLGRMIRQYDGDLRLALLAYNRGPGTVDSIRRSGGDPGNGYARKVLGGRRGD